MQIRLRTSPTEQAWGIAILRVIVGLVFLIHGLQKTFILGTADVATFLAQAGVPLPMTSAVVVTAVETLCGLALIVGFLTRWTAIPLAIDMLVAAAFVHVHAGFFLPNGYEYVLTLFAACVSLSLLGSGRYAMDNVLPAGTTAARAETRSTGTKAA